MDGTLPNFLILKLQGRGGSHYTSELDGGGFSGHYPFIILKNSLQDLSNEGSKKSLSLLELGF
jgi:hypothetical protein